jgi:hypothetical protein
MAIYLRNRYCRCQRCITRGLLGPSVLITLGVMFLLDSFDWRFENTWPVLLIVIGVFLYFSRIASTEGHIQPFGLDGLQPQAPPPPPPPAQQPNDPQVRQ